MISCLVCRLERWATSAQHQIQRCAVWLGNHVNRPSYHPDFVLCSPWIDKPQGRWVFKSIILIGFLQFVFAATIQMSSRFWAWDSLIPRGNSWDPLITMNTVAVVIACDVWAVCPDFRLILYQLGWFGTMCFSMWCLWHARPKFRRIRRPPQKSNNRSKAGRHCNHIRCGRVTGRCRSHAARCIHFYMHDCLIQQCKLQNNRTKVCHDDFYVWKKSHAPQSARFLYVAIQIYLTSALVSCALFAQQWEFACGNQQSLPQERMHLFGFMRAIVDLTRRKVWWNSWHQRLHRLWLFHDWFHDYIGFGLPSSLIHCCYHNCQDDICCPSSTSNRTMHRHFCVSKKCAWIAAMMG